MHPSATLSLSKAIDGTHAYMVCIYMITTCISISMRLPTDSSESPRRACTTNMPTCVSRVCLGAPVSALKSPRRNVRALSHRRRPRADRVAGVLLRLGVQREYRLVEHCACHHIVQGMRHSRPAARHRGGRARPVFDAARPVLDAALPMRARCCARTHVWALGHAGVNVCTYSCASERWNICYA
jgi:hypothetical protein